MRPEHVTERVERIRGLTHDPEAAHDEEDRLRADVLRAIADGTAEQPAECARITLTTDAIKFDRWCA